MKNINNYIGFSPEIRSYLSNMSLPVIRGKWFFVDPYKTGERPENSFDTVLDAYNACVDGRGDGIAIFSGGTTTANTTSYLSAELVWAKNGITVFGIGAPCRMAQRTRISNVVHTTGSQTTLAFVAGAEGVYDKITRSAGSFVTNGFVVGETIRVNTTGNGADATGLVITAVTASTLTLATIGTLVTETAPNAGASVVSSYCANLITVSGSNNAFLNLHIYMGDSDALALTGLKITGSRNYFGNIHVGTGLASATTDVTRSLWLYAASENTFENCTFGLDTVDRGNNATYDILIQGACSRNRFINCETIRHTSVGVACFAVYFNTTTGGRPTLFDNCRFTCWSTASGNANQTVCLGSTGACDDVWLTGNSCHAGYAALGMSGIAWIQGANIASGVAGLLTTT